MAADFLATHAHNVLVTAGLLQLIPALIRAFAGAPLLAREFETGTFRYAWTQGFPRVRWTVAKLMMLALLVTMAAGAFSVLFSWYYQPTIGAGGRDSGPLYPTIFDMRGMALAGWTLVAFAIGVLAGILIRRVIPALFATLVVWVGLAFATGAFLRPHYEAPLITSTSRPKIAESALVINQGWFEGGKPVTLSAIQEALHRVDIRVVTPGQFSPGPATPANPNPVHYLIQHGFTQLTSYQPASWFWRFQWIEAS